METMIKVGLVVVALLAGAFIYWFYRRGETIKKLEADLTVERSSSKAEQAIAQKSQEDANAKLEDYNRLRDKHRDLLKRLGLWR